LKYYKALILLYNLFFVISCATPGLTERQKTAKIIAEKAGFQRIIFNTELFKLYGWQKIDNIDKKALVIYIEGDGKAWQGRFKVSKNPTPVNPIALRLAVQDKRANIIYLARPCQFFSIQSVNNCSAKYWTSHRYSQEVINAYSVALKQIIERYSIDELSVVGFSGGGVIAALLAAQRSDIVSLTTVASNLDHFNWSLHHKVSSLNGSLSVYPYISALAEVTQFHLWGSNDLIVPFKVNKNLLGQLLKHKTVNYTIYNGFDHVCCWAEQWPDILNKNKLRVENN